MTNIISLQSNNISTTSAIKLLNAEISYSWKNLVTTDPSNSSYGSVESQFSGWENPQISLTFYIPQRNPSGFMTWALWHEFVKNQYVGTDASKIYLSASLGTSDVLLSSFAASSLASSTYPIPVQIKSYNMRVSADESKGNLLVINAQLTETI